MTTQQNDNDPRVSATYRELATDKAPAELDDKVLAMAASAARTRYGLTRAWIRPVAWAATIGLSLAFILEMSQFPKASAPPADSAPAAPAPTEPAPTAPAAAKREASVPAAADPAPIQPMATSELDADDMNLLEEAEKQADTRARQARPAVADAAFAVMAETTAEKKEQVAHCDAEARADAETWYECIEILRDEGRGDAAIAELEALREAFPDFSEPVPK